MANDGNRHYCQEKYGRKDYCKHRAKWLRENRPEAFEEGGVIAEQKLPTPQAEKSQNNNTEGFWKLLGSQKEVNVSGMMLKKHNIDIRQYDRIITHPRDPDLRIAEFGDYALAWVEPDLFLLTFSNRMLWITQI
ncbi:MAG: hypothetical protein C0594_09395 [Marinilabiliales bacterium]|nr:MAG: hypothetical protein C0594_09395 [Marinilabiliales bacterium]